MSSGIFESAVRASGDLAGVFEHDGETAYFYLYRLSDGRPERVVDSLHVFSGATDLRDADVTVRWDRCGSKVGLFLRGVLWAVFNPSHGTKFGGGYGATRSPSIPDAEAFDP